MVKGKTVAVVGASSKKNRYSNLAVKKLNAKGYDVMPVHPSGIPVNNNTTKTSLKEIKTRIHTLSIYVNPKISDELADDILNISPERVIFNPGTENTKLYELLQKNGIKVEEACTLVMLQTNKF